MLGELAMHLVRRTVEDVGVRPVRSCVVVRCGEGAASRAAMHIGSWL